MLRLALFRQLIRRGDDARHFARHCAESQASSIPSSSVVSHSWVCCQKIIPYLCVPRAHFSRIYLMPVSQITWWQRRRTLNLTITYSGDAPKQTVEENRLQLIDPKTGDAWSHPLNGEVKPATARWSSPKPDRLELRVRKAASGYWKLPFAQRLGCVKPDWDLWVDDEDDGSDDDPDDPNPRAESADAPGASPASSAAEVPGWHHEWQPAGGVLDVPSTAEGDAWQEVWRGMSLPQRMLTMAMMWNHQDEEARRASAQRLLSLLGAAGGPLAEMQKSIKGGNALLRNLDVSVYNAEKAPMLWLTEFTALGQERKVELMAHLFTLLPADEQKMVVAQLA